MADEIDVRLAVPPRTKLEHAKLPAEMTLGQARQDLAKRYGLDPETTKILFRGREVKDELPLVQAGVKDGSKLSLAPTGPASKRRDKASAGEESTDQGQQGSALDGRLDGLQLGEIRREVDALEEKVRLAEQEEGPLDEKEVRAMGEYLQRAMEALDSISAESDHDRQQRKAQVDRVNTLLDVVEGFSQS